MGDESAARYRKVLVNYRYGGFGFNSAFEEEFKRRHPEKEQILGDCNWGCVKARSDPDIVGLWEEMGKEAEGAFAKIETELVHVEMLPYARISEYDGYESLKINSDRAYCLLCHEFAAAVEKTNEKSEELTSLLEKFKRLEADVKIKRKYKDEA